MTGFWSGIGLPKQRKGDCHCCDVPPSGQQAFYHFACLVQKERIYVIVPFFFSWSGSTCPTKQSDKQNPLAGFLASVK